MSGRDDLLFNPLGFNKEVAGLLTGLRCSNLREFKKRNVGRDDLRHLSDEDLAVLNVGDDFDHESFKRMSANLRKKYDRDVRPRAQDVFQVLASNNRQLEVLNIYIKCLEILLLRNRTDYFIDKNKNLRASQALVQAVDCVLQEIEEFESLIDTQLMNSSVTPKKKNHKMKYTLILAGLGVSIMTFIFYKRLMHQ